MRKLCWFTAGFAGVCLLCCYGPAGLYRPLAPVFAGLCLVVFALWRRFRQSPARAFAVFRRGLALCLGGALAAGWFWGWTAVLRAPADALAGQTLALSGTVASQPADTSIGGYSLTVSLDGGWRSPDLLLYAGEDWGGLRPGDRVSFTARLTDADRLRGDESTYFTAKGIFLLGYCNEAPEAVERPEHLPLRFWPARCAQALGESLTAAFDPDAAPLAVALVTGDRSGLSEGLSANLSRAGAAHTVVVSGMHVSCLVFAAMALLQNRRRLAFTVIPLLLFYALMTGGAPSSLRAAAMQGVLLCAPLARRESDGPTALALALFLLLLLNPYAAGSVSLQLSFTSVAGILAVTPRLMKPMLAGIKSVRKRHAGRSWSLLCGGLQAAACSLAAGLGAMLFSQPVLALYFHRASLVFPLTNLLVLWAVQLLLPCALFTGCLGLVLPGAASALGWLFGWLARYITAVVSVLGGWRFASVDTRNFFALVCVAAVYLFLALWLAAGEERPRLRVLLVGMVPLAGAALCLTWLPVHSSLLTVTALDVGQGSATAFLSRGGTCLVDCGGSASESAGDIAADYFAGLGITRLDLLVLTHFDADHTNGLERLFERMEVTCTVIPAGELTPEAPAELAELLAAHTQVVPVSEPLRQLLGAARLTLYPPLGGGTTNESGLFVLCSAGDFDVLVTGDADAFVEKMLIKYFPLPDIEVLVAGHHGADGSTSRELLERTRPELALISAGYNTYGHPGEETLARLSALGVSVFRTDQLGTVSLLVSRDGEDYDVRFAAQ